MKGIWTLFFLITIGLLPLPGQAAAVSIQNLRMWRAPDHTRLVFDLSAPLEHRVFTLKDPERIVIDVGNVRLHKPLPRLNYDGPLLKGVRTGNRGEGNFRIVLDLKRPTTPRTYVLKPYGQYGYRLVVDLQRPEAPSTLMPSPTKKPAPRTIVSNKPPARKRELVIAIDAGHGGEDPGAIGRRYRTREKRVVLAIARDLERLVTRERGMRPLMIRKGDYYVGLRERRRLAYRHRADLFISIHADSLRNGRARGASVYALSLRGATSSRAKLLAERENASDLLGGVRLDDKDNFVQITLMDLSQTAAIADSLALGKNILRSLKKVGPIHISRVGQAGFAVLKEPDIPSVLVETAFISDPAEEKKLRTRSFQRRMARGIFNGVKRYVARSGLQPSPRATTLARTNRPARRRHEHIVKRGETLSGIAQRYGVKIETLRLANNIRGNKLLAGRRLRIP